jgi:hypothetical protein
MGQHRASAGEERRRHTAARGAATAAGDGSTREVGDDSRVSWAIVRHRLLQSGPGDWACAGENKEKYRG